MNGLQITGMKLSSPAPTKKTVPLKKTAEKSKVVSNAAPRKTTTPIVANTQNKLIKKVESKIKVEEVVQKPKVEQVKIVTPQKQEPEKKEEEKKKEEKQDPEKQEPEKQEEETKKKEEEIPDFQVLLRYNHYKDKFQCEKGVLSFKAPNEKYCFGLVFLGNYQPKIRNFKTRDIIEPLTTGIADQFTWRVEEGEAYEIQIDEDEEEEQKRQRHVYRAPEQPKKCPMKKNGQVEQLTQEMKRMGVDELGSAKHRQLLEQRDLQDILFS